MNIEQAQKQKDQEALDKAVNKLGPIIRDCYPSTEFSLGQRNTIRYSINMSRDDINQIRSIMPDYGMLANAIKLYVKHLCEYVKRFNLTIDDREQLVDYINSIDPDHQATLVAFAKGNITANAVGPTQSGLNREGPHRDDRGGTRPVRQDDPVQADKSTTDKREPATTPLSGRKSKSK